jgi:hypothetical protein
MSYCAGGKPVICFLDISEPESIEVVKFEDILGPPFLVLSDTSLPKGE